MGSSGFLVSFEGIDGSGKSTQITLLADRLRDMGVAPVLAQEPGGTRLGRRIREVLLDVESAEMDPRTEALLFFASRVQNLAEVIRPALQAGRVVIVDRFIDSTVAYQGLGRGLGTRRVWELHEIACDGILPDLTVWLDIDPQTAVRRARRRSASVAPGGDLMEARSMRFFGRVREGYAMAHADSPDRVRRVSADCGVKDLAGRVWSCVHPALKARGHLDWR